MLLGTLGTSLLGNVLADKEEEIELGKELLQLVMGIKDKIIRTK